VGNERWKLRVERATLRYLPSGILAPRLGLKTFIVPQSVALGYFLARRWRSHRFSGTARIGFKQSGRSGVIDNMTPDPALANHASENVRNPFGSKGNPFISKTVATARWVGIVTLVLTAWFTGSSLADEAPSTATAPSAYPSDGGMAEKLKPFLDDQTIAGAVVFVADKEKVLDAEAMGYADTETKRPMRIDDLFYIASMTKMFTSAALMMMVDEGKVNLDDPVEKYLPEFKTEMVEEAENKGHPHPPSHPVTIKEIMSHTAGLLGGPRPKHTLEDLVKDLAQSPLQWNPGTKYKYSPGPTVGGRIVEVVSGTPYPDFIQKRLLDPLGLKDTTFWPTVKQASHLALTHELNPVTKTLVPIHHNTDLLQHPEKIGKVPPIILSQFPANSIQDYPNHFANPAGSLFSTGADITKFCQMLLNNGTWQGKEYLTPKAIQLMSTRYTGDLVKGPDGYGIGCFVHQKETPGGPSLGSYGHHGARKTQMWIDPHYGLVMVLMVQCTELTNVQQTALYDAYKKQAIARYGKPKS
jgi:CubicO group peptidase (beta-lactamase class C family)